MLCDTKHTPKKRKQAETAPPPAPVHAAMHFAPALLRPQQVAVSG
jgi:hypothetical protein